MERIINSKNHGFTLIEVLVSLLIISIGLGALMVACSENIRLYQKIQDKMFANWVAIETFNKIQLHLLNIPDSQAKNGKREFLGQKIQWQIKRLSLQQKHLSQIEFSYRFNDKTPYQPYMFGYRIYDNENH